VCLVDYGYLDKVPGSELRALKKSFGKLECFAERCHLANILPAGTTDRTKWSHTATDFVTHAIKGRRLFVKLEVR
jgi:hypothetical protein